MTAKRQATPRQRHTSAWLFLRSLILAVGCYGAVTSAQAADSDGDGLDDSVETNTGNYVSSSNTGTDPTKADTDGDGMNDAYELGLGRISFRATPRSHGASGLDVESAAPGAGRLTLESDQEYEAFQNLVLPALNLTYSGYSWIGAESTLYGNGNIALDFIGNPPYMWNTGAGVDLNRFEAGTATTAGPENLYGGIAVLNLNPTSPNYLKLRGNYDGSAQLPALAEVAGFTDPTKRNFTEPFFANADFSARNLSGWISLQAAPSFQSDGSIYIHEWSAGGSLYTQGEKRVNLRNGLIGVYVTIYNPGSISSCNVRVRSSSLVGKIPNWESSTGFRLREVETPSGFHRHYCDLREFDGELVSIGVTGGEVRLKKIEAVYVLSASVSTPTATSITATSAILGGEVTADGGATITERGVVYSATATNADPIVGGTGVIKAIANGTTAVFTAPVSELTPGANYSYKAFATNSLGTTYSSVATFTTLSTNADLSALTLSSGMLSPNFASGTSAYTASVSNATTSITVTPTRSQANATVEARVNGGSYAPVSSATASGALLLNVGINIVDLRVTAQDGTTQRTYTVTVTRMAQLASNVTATQRPGTKLVDITYDLAAPGFGAVAVILEASSDGGATWTVPVASATGAVGGSVTPGTGKAIAWNAGSDWPQSYSTQMQFRVVADDLVPQGFSSIPGGSFTMGRTSGDGDGDAPPITVTVSPFYLQQTEATYAQWSEVRTWAESNGYTDLGAGSVKPTNNYWNYPVASVDWWDVVKWCNARSEKEGLTPVYTVAGAVMRTGTTAPLANWSANGYRLPTEAEWEKAARGGVEGMRFPWGTDTISHAQANYLVYSEDGTTNSYSYDVEPRPPATANYHHPSYTAGGTPYTSPVGSFAANGYGLYDMAGNVMEWSWDWYGESYYTTSNGTTDPRGPASGTDRVVRGGFWNFHAFLARCADRAQNRPDGTFGYDVVGFRLARSSVGSSISQTVSQTETINVDTRDAPTVTTPTATSITATSATLGGNVTADGGATITERGVVYAATAANADPAIGGTGVTKITATGTTEVFTAPVTGLTQGSGYSYKAYATNSQGTSYSTVVTFTTLSTMATPTATSITTTGATLGGTVVSLAGGRAVERGIVYSEVAANADPQLEGLGVIKLPRSGSIGTFTVAASGLSPAKTYAYRAYLTTSIETSYSGVGYFTTDTPVAFTAGIGTVANRVIRGGESQLFVFDLAQSSAAAFSTTGASPAMQWELHDAINALVDSGTGNIDFSNALALGGYQLRITNPGASTETFSLNLDASTPASPRPDISVGLDPTASSGVDLYDPPAPQQSVLAISTKAAIKNVFFRIDNDGPLPDAMRINGPGHDSRFRVLYVLAGRNVTAAVIAGTATTSVLAAADAPVPLFVRISPNRKNPDILRKVVVTQRPTWVYGRETFGPNGLTVRATTDPTLSDTATFQLNTVP